MSSVAAIDWVILAIIAFSTLISIARGFVKEALSLATLVVAMIISRMFGSQVSTLLVDVIEVAAIRNVVAYVGLFFATLIVGGLLSRLAVQMVRMAGLGGMDRVLGVLFGFARGGLIIVVIVAVAARLGVAEETWWQDSLLIPRFIAFGDWIQMTGWENADDVLQRVQST